MKKIIFKQYSQVEGGINKKRSTFKIKIYFNQKALK